MFKIDTDAFNFINTSTYTGNPACTDWTIPDYGIKEDFDNGLIDYLPNEYWDNFNYKEYQGTIDRLVKEFWEEVIIPEFRKIVVDGIEEMEARNCQVLSYFGLHLCLVVNDDFKEDVICRIEEFSRKEEASYLDFLKENMTPLNGNYAFVEFAAIEQVVSNIKENPIGPEVEGFFRWFWGDQIQSNIDLEEKWIYFLQENIHRSDFLPDDFAPISRHLVNSFPDTLVKTLCSELREVGDTSAELVSKIIQQVIGDDSDHPLYFNDSESETYLQDKVREALVDSSMPLLNSWNLTPNKFEE